MTQADDTLSRRRLLRAAGFSIVLPALASLGEMPLVQTLRGGETGGGSSGPDGSQPKRFCCIFFPNGVSLPPKGHAAHEQ